ncbi:unnamed protein product [Diabrotica balteata]|uniref:Nas2 N-terminal domain-containing protein n=1 Tax=Diabrotica balteata TaxID=107213 RepID=A0A9N9SW21_DIABA|nr:unnamed protein product [Diabrotica balteata]
MSREDVREQVLELMSRKDKIEAEIKDLTCILTQNGVGMNEPLVDSQGFPKSSIDVYQVRHARHRIICLQNDHKSLMKQIENGLHGYYSATSLDSNLNNAVAMETDPSNAVVHTEPFAKVTIVSDNSPAYFAGIDVGDLIVEFGSINKTNFKVITDIGTLVQHTEGNLLNVKVKRGDRFFTLQLIPKKWIGRGLLGCNIVSL